MSLGEESSSDNGLRNTLKTNGETLSDCPIPLLDVTALAENDSGSTYIVQETRSLEMKGLCGRDWDAVNRLEALLEKHLQGRFKSEGDELPSLSLSFWREGNICSQGAVEGNSTTDHVGRQSKVPGTIISEVEVVTYIGDGSPYTFPIRFWGQWKFQ